MKRKEDKNINIDIKIIKKLIENVVLNSYGVMGLYKENEKGSPAIAFRLHAKNTFSVDVKVVLANDLKVSEIISELQKNLYCSLNKAYVGCVKHVNVYAMGIVGKKL